MAMSQQYKNPIIVVGLIVLFIFTFSWHFSIINQLPMGHLGTSELFDDVPAPSDLVNLGFSHFAVMQAREQEMQREHDYPLTGIVLHWKWLEGVRHAVHRLLDSRLFKELIVWNNNPEINLTADAVVPNNHSSNLIRVINSKENIKDEAKYRACSEAKTTACYYADDDWDTSDYIRSLVASFRADPTRLHSVTDPGTYYTNLMWSYFDSQIDLHTGFSWIGAGSVFLREHAQRHLQLLHRYLEKEPDLLRFSDVFFSLWLNDVPTQLNANIRHLPGAHSGPAFSSTANFLDRQYRSSILAIRILEKVLRLNQSNSSVAFPRQQNRFFPVFVKSPGPQNSFIFYSNVLPLDFERVPFNITRDFERGTRKNLPRDDGIKHFHPYGTLQAVDNDNTTCWHTHRAIRPGDFFAIDFLRIRPNITFSLVIAHNLTLQFDLETSISLDGLWWMPYRSLKGITFQNNTNSSDSRLRTLVFHSAQFTLGFQSFRHIAFRAVHHSESVMRVCEIKVVENLGHPRN